MKRSDSIVKIAAALLKAQKDMGGASKGAANPYFKSKYADYGSVLEACKDLLNANGIVILQPHAAIADSATGTSRNYVETTLIHESGEFISSQTEVICAKQNDPQALGSAITYARRYGLQSLLAMPAEDDDGEGAMNRAPKTAPKAAEVKTPMKLAATTTAAATAPITNVASAPVNTTPTVAAPAKKSSFKAAVKATAKPAEAPKVSTPVVANGVTGLDW